MILITGSSGFIGTNMVKFCQKNNIKFHAVDLNKNRYLKFKNFTKLDLSKASSVKKLFRKIRPRILIHLAAVSGVSSCNHDIPGAFKKNIQATFNLFNYSKDFNCKKILIASSQAAGKFNINPSLYAFTKKTCEDMGRSFKENFKLNVSILRFSNVYGPFSLHKTSAIHQMMKCLVKNKTFEIHGNGKQLRDFIYVNDLIKRVIQISKAKFVREIYDIKTYKSNTINYVINSLNSFSKKKLKVKKIKPPSGYDVSYLKKYKEKENKRLDLNLKITFNWYKSKKL